MKYNEKDKHSCVCRENLHNLLEFVKNGRDGLKIEEPLYIYNEQGEYTEEIQKNFS